MTQPSLDNLLHALQIAAFARGTDGSFSPVATVPVWFSRLVADGTFPFLGHILQEANEFWAGGTEGSREFGPCAEVDDAGHEFHYKVLAVSATGEQYLVFQPDAGADRMREVLQKARELSLRGDAENSTRAAFSVLAKEARTTADEISELTVRLQRAHPSEKEHALLEQITAQCNRLRSCAENMALLPSTSK